MLFEFKIAANKIYIFLQKRLDFESDKNISKEGAAKKLSRLRLFQ